MTVEVKIGVKYANRELSVDTESTQEQVLTQLREALAADGEFLTLNDANGRTVAVPADKVIYLSFAQENLRKVGFGK